MTTHDITLTVNGTDHDLAVESRTLLVHALRDELGYTGTNVGCESSLCGACTVLVDGDAVKSCTELAVRADGAEVETVEGLADGGDFHPIQEGFQEEHGLQCGYCTPGMMLSAVDLLDENPDPDDEEIREALEGNLCRCTGYQNIVNAVQNAAGQMSGAVADGGKEMDLTREYPTGDDASGGDSA
ncbi:(2Fe-2S)-binding protein [Halobacterium litoreum]|uniref:(2Fe-2S)-binding protein n=1 Tax=Halobacterium litoreum TaxID=2039234 RepID=A0ABD5NF70_9EURY|nr:(2Fe-2S)-binding protein [Halobacterium litoreum]UHH13221.1 (2Fe-2S)-binding protein [Halobacterium litoreum]